MIFPPPISGGISHRFGKMLIKLLGIPFLHLWGQGVSDINILKMQVHVLLSIKFHQLFKSYVLVIQNFFYKNTTILYLLPVNSTML
jgi:hypothetical protein